MSTFSIAYPALTYRYGPFPLVGGMSRPRTELSPLVIAQTDCVAIIADTPEKSKALDAAMLDIFRARNAYAACHDPASWLDLGEVLHAARQAGCPVRNLPPALDTIPHDDPTTALAGC